MKKCQNSVITFTSLFRTWIEQENKKEDKKMFRERNKREKVEKMGSLLARQMFTNEPTTSPSLERLVPSCCVIFDLEPLSLSFDFVFSSEISKSLSFSLDRLCHLAILCLDQHAHTSHLFESLLTISLDRLDILKEDLFEHEHVVMNRTSAGMRHLHLHLYMNPEIKQLAIKHVDSKNLLDRVSSLKL
ncbi:hypothetical protein Tco_0885405 [Tanacetum coccineum]